MRESWPRVPVLPDPEEDIRLLGIPVGRLIWIGPLFTLPTILAIIAVSTGLTGVLPIAGLMAVLVYVLGGLDLWRPLSWVFRWLARPERRGTRVRLSAGAGQLPEGAGLVTRLAAGKAEGAPGDNGSRSPPAAIADPAPLDHGDPLGAWRRWSEALRRAVGRGATVQMLTWIEPDWDPLVWENESDGISRVPGERLQDLAAQRWVWHQHVALAYGRWTPHMVRVIPGPGAGPGELVEIMRHAGQALAGAGTWRPLRGPALEDTLWRWGDWGGWFLAAGGGTPDLASLWSDELGADAPPAEEPDAGTGDRSASPAEDTKSGDWDDWIGEDDAADTGPLDAGGEDQTIRPDVTVPPAPPAPVSSAAVPAPSPEGRLGTLTALAAGAIQGIMERARQSVARRQGPATEDRTSPQPVAVGSGVVAILGRGGVGKTTVAAGLAAAMGRAGASVVAVDAARPHPRLGYLLGAWQTSGFREALDGAPLEWCTSGAAAPGVDVIASGVASLAGKPLPDPAAVMTLVRNLAPHYDWVLVDLPGDLSAPEVVGALRVADVALWVVDGDPIDLMHVRDGWRRLTGVRQHAAILVRPDPRAGYDARRVSDYLDLPVLAEIPEQRGEQWQALARGTTGIGECWDQAAAALTALLAESVRAGAGN